jgi:hypothetical protein
MFRNGNRNFAYFCHHDGAGMVGNDGFIGYQNGVNKLIYNSFGENNPKADSLTRLSKAFQQSVYEDYRLK